MIFFPVMQTAPNTDAGDRQTDTRSMLVRAVELRVRAGATNLEPAIRRALADAHPEIAVTRILPLDVQVAGNFRNNRLLATLAGSYAAALTIFAGLSDVSPVGLPAPTGVDARTAERLQHAAQAAIDAYADYQPPNVP